MLRKAFLIFAFTYCALAQDKLVRISKSIIINNSTSEVFELVKNTMNDYHWRSEVNTMEADGEFQVGTIFTEDARIGLNSNFITRTQLVQLENNKLAYYITPKSEPYYLTSKREVTQLDAARTKFTYTVEFDPAMSKKALGFGTPSFLMKIYYTQIIKSYLRTLKKYLESKS